MIYAELISPALSTFGFSLSGGLDMDGNEYPDLLVGAYDSDRVVYLKSRPVVQLSYVNIAFDVDSKQVDLENKSCSLLDGTAVACVPLSLSLEYTGKGVDEHQDVEVQIVLDAKNSKSPRMMFLSTEGKSILNERLHFLNSPTYFGSRLKFCPHLRFEYDVRF